MARVRYMETMVIADPADGALTALEGLQVYVYFQGTQVTAPIYNVRTSGTPIQNPMITDSQGRIAFFADTGEYDVRVVDSEAPARVADQTYQVSLSEPMVDKSVTSRKLSLDIATQLASPLLEVAQNSTNTTYTELISTTVNAPYASTRYLVMVAIPFFYSNSYGGLSHRVDGVEEINDTHGYQGAITADIAYHRHYLKTVNAGAHTFAVFWRWLGSSSGIYVARATRRIDVICLGAG